MRRADEELPQRLAGSPTLTAATLTPATRALLELRPGTAEEAQA